MTDDTAPQSAERKIPSNHHDQIIAGVELEYPQLLLEASFDSLLTHSCSSAASTVVNMPRTNHALSESWASLSDADYSQEEDLQSETTDVGSLIDGASVQDVHSVNESAESSEAEDGEELQTPGILRAASGMLQHPPTHSASTSRSVSGHSDIGRSTSASLVDVEVEASRTENEHISNKATETSLDAQLEVTPDQITIPRATSQLDLVDRPFRILYLKTSQASHLSEVAVLSKIGAALVSDNKSLGASQNYHVIPSEFGPGSWPSSSELIPVTQQLAVQECHFPKLGALSSSPDTVILEQPDGSTVIFSGAKGVQIMKQGKFIGRPDIWLILTSEHDSSDDRTVINRILSLAQRCHLPCLVIEDSVGRSKNPARLDIKASNVHKYVSDIGLKPQAGARLPVNVHEFTSFESGHLNRHLQFLVEANSTDRMPPVIHTKEKVAPYQRNVSGWLDAQSKGHLGDGNQQDLEDDGMSMKDKPNANYRKTTSAWLRSWRQALPHLLLAIFVPFLWYIMTISGSDHDVTSILRSESLSTPTSTIPASSPTSSTLSHTSIVPADQEKEKKTNRAELSLFSGMLHEVAEYLPVQKSVTKAQVSQSSYSQQPIPTLSTRVCDSNKKTVNTERGDIVILSEEFYDTNTPRFSISVTRGTRTVPFTIQAYGYDRYLVKVDGKELYGRLTVSILPRNDLDKVTCVSIGLNNNPIEGGTSIVDRRAAGHGRLANQRAEWTLIRLRKANEGKFSGFRVAAEYAMNTFDALSTAVEDMSAAQILACHHNSDECWRRKIKQYKEQFAASRRACEQKVVDSAKQARGRAEVLANEVFEQTTKVLDSVRPSVPDVSEIRSRLTHSKNKLSKHVTRKVCKAQRRARKLVHRGARHL